MQGRGHSGRDTVVLCRVVVVIAVYPPFVAACSSPVFLVVHWHPFLREQSLAAAVAVAGGCWGCRRRRRAPVRHQPPAMHPASSGSQRCGEVCPGRWALPWSSMPSRSGGPSPRSGPYPHSPVPVVVVGCPGVVVVGSSSWYLKRLVSSKIIRKIKTYEKYDKKQRKNLPGAQTTITSFKISAGSGDRRKGGSGVVDSGSGT